MAGILLVLAFVALWRFLAVPQPTLERDASGAVVEAQTTAIALARAGDCIESLPQEEDAVANEVRFVPCATPHQAVALGTTQASETGTTEAAQAALVECLDIAETVTGINPDAPEATYRLTILPPGGALTSYLCLADYAPNPAP